jgi:hypothetical protein
MRGRSETRASLKRVSSLSPRSEDLRTPLLWKGCGAGGNEEGRGDGNGGRGESSGTVSGSVVITELALDTGRAML